MQANKKIDVKNISEGMEEKTSPFANSMVVRKQDKLITKPMLLSFSSERNGI